MISQLAVAVAGLVAAVIIYFAVHAYATGSFTQVTTGRQAALSQEINKDFGKVEASYENLASVVSIMNRGVGLDPELARNVLTQMTFKEFDAVFWIKLSAIASQQALAPAALIGNTNPSLINSQYFTPENVTALKTFMSENKGIGAAAIIPMNIKPLPYYTENWAVAAKPFAVGHVLGAGPAAGILITVISPKAVFLHEELASFANVAKLDLQMDGLMDPLLTVTDSGNTKDLMSLETAPLRIDKQLFGTYVSGRATYLPSGLMNAFLLVPFMAAGGMLVFTGLILVVRMAGHKRAKDMAGMNKNLTDKNYELSLEMRKRERLNFAVRKSERENRAIINSVSDVIFEVDANCDIQFINETWSRITGLEIGETIGKRLTSFFSQKDRFEQEREMYLLINRQKGPYTAKINILTKDGQERPAEMRISMLRQDEGKNLRVVGTITDLEERMRAEAAVAAAEENYKRIWANMANGIYECDVNGRLISANPAMAKILGFASPEEVIKAVSSMHTTIYVKPEEKAQHLQEANRTGEPERFEIQAKHRDGSKIWINESIRAIKDAQGNITHYEGTIDDITERKNADLALKKAKLESDMANRAKSDFLANMSHELRTPLNSIIGFAGIIKDQAMGPIGDPNYLEYASEIHTSGRGLLNIINQILDVSKIEGGDRSLNESLVNLHKATNVCVDLMATKIAEKGLRVTNRVPEDVEDLIAEDRSVRQMVYNLFSIAVKFTEDNGAISIDCGLNNRGEMCLAISDSGVGMSPEELERA
ncbi:MAG: PAS domain S-box protein, partial [Pseudobdellovibrionaceae bacterium]